MKTAVVIALKSETIVCSLKHENYDKLTLKQDCGVASVKQTLAPTPGVWKLQTPAPTPPKMTKQTPAPTLPKIKKQTRRIRNKNPS